MKKLVKIRLQKDSLITVFINDNVNKDDVTVNIDGVVLAGSPKLIPPKDSTWIETDTDDMRFVDGTTIHPAHTYEKAKELYKDGE